MPCHAPSSPFGTRRVPRSFWPSLSIVPCQSPLISCWAKTLVANIVASAPIQRTFLICDPPTEVLLSERCVCFDRNYSGFRMVRPAVLRDGAGVQRLANGGVYIKLLASFDRLARPRVSTSSGSPLGVGHF